MWFNSTNIFPRLYLSAQRIDLVVVFTLTYFEGDRNWVSGEEITTPEYIFPRVYLSAQRIDLVVVFTLTYFQDDKNWVSGEEITTPE